MEKTFYKKYVAIASMLLFVMASIVPGIYGNTESFNDKDICEKEHFSTMEGIILSEKNHFDGMINNGGISISSFNNPPDFVNDYIGGPPSPRINKIYLYWVTPIDPDGDNCTTTWDWGDGTIETTSLKPSEQTHEIQHMYTKPGTFHIRVYATDEHGANSRNITKLIITPRLWPDFLIGFVTNVQEYDNNYLMFNPVLLFILPLPSEKILYTSGTVYLRKDYIGNITEKFIIAIGQALVLT
jgi:hypothetical protein